jgi:uncharacterized protein (TIGR03790 family)
VHTFCRSLFRKMYFSLVRGFPLLFWLAAQVQASPGESQLSERVLVVYNKSESESAKVAKYYLSKRGIPAANTCKIDPLSTDFVEQEDFESEIRKPIRKCLEAIGRPKILYIVFSYQTPFLLKFEGHLYSLDQFVADIWDDYLPMRPATQNEQQPYLGRAQSEGNFYEPFASLSTYREKPGARQIYSVWRLDAATPALAKGLVDKATNAEANGLKGTACFDRRVEDMRGVSDFGTGAGDWDIYRSAEFARKAGFPVLEDGHNEEFGTAPAPLRCDGAALYSGWYSLNHYNDAFTWNQGAIGIHLDSASAGHPRSGSNWAANAVIKGITVTSGAVDEPYLENLPHPDQVFLYLFQGANVGDAFLRSTRLLKWRIINIGDPLYRPFPGGIQLATRPSPELILALLPQWMAAGTTSTGAIILTGTPPETPAKFDLKSSRPELVTVPESVLLPVKTDHVKFAIETRQAANNGTTVRISVSGNGLKRSNTLVLFQKAAQ